MAVECVNVHDRTCAKCGRIAPLEDCKEILLGPEVQALQEMDSVIHIICYHCGGEWVC